MKAGILDENSFTQVRIYCTALVLVGSWSLLAWSYFHGGVPSHHLLADKDLPSVSNWWGGLIVPLLTWLLLYRLHQRILHSQQQLMQPLLYQRQIVYGFVGALLFGILISILFTIAYTDLAGYLLLTIFFLAFFFPLYRAECLLGFVLGMTFTFGGVLPTGIGAILVAISAVLYLLVRPALLYTVSTLARVTSFSK